MTNVALSWSSGKDSAWTLHVLRQKPDVEVCALITTFNSEADRVAMHSVRRELVEAQADRVGLPLWAIELFERRLRTSDEIGVSPRDGCGNQRIAFGDLFLQDIRHYRERQLKGSGLSPIFPLWQIPTGLLAHLRFVLVVSLSERMSPTM